MAQGDVAAAAAAVGVAMTSSDAHGLLGRTPEELHQMRQFDRIVQFRDAVISGTHPRVKIPAHLVSTKAGASRSPHLPQSSDGQLVAFKPYSRVPPADESSALAAPKSSSQQPHLGQRVPNSAQTMENLRTFQANTQRPAAGGSPSGLASIVVTDGPKTSGPGRAEIDPVLLEKSDDLIRAEIQHQRTRAERALRDQLEQRRNANRQLQASESLPDFDLGDVLQKALVLVESAAAGTADPNVAANKSDVSASFDDNAFYSSDFGTPEPAHGTRIPDDSEEEDVEMRDSSDYEPQLDLSEIPSPIERAPSVPQGQPQAAAQGDYPSGPSALARHPSPSRAAPGPGAPAHGYGSGAVARDAQAPRNGRVLEVISSAESGEASASGESANADNEQSADDSRALRPQRRPLEAALGRVEPPLVRGHDLSPFAPQPAHVSPLVTSRQLPATLQEAPLIRGTPAQVTALRKNGSTGTSPESSPHAAPGAEKRKGKKKNKKRKADRQTIDAAASPFIKPEPTSPSPMTAPAFARPQKRQKQGQRGMQQAGYDEPRYEQHAADPYQGSGRYGAGTYGETEAPVVYERRVEFFPRSGAAPIVVQDSPTQHQDLYEERRPPPAAEYHQRPRSPGPYPAQYPPRDRTTRAASTAVIDLAHGYRGSARDVHREGYYELRDTRPTVDRNRSRSPVMYSRTPAVVPVARVPQPARVVIDESGREYIEPPRPAPALPRHSLAPQGLRGEAEVVYERVAPPHRAASRIPDTFEENGVIYRRASPGYVAPRRVVTQPEYQHQEYRAYRQPEYSARPLGPPTDEYAPARPVMERRALEEPPREYVGRATSTRPPEPIRYAEAGRGYAEGPGSVRPEVPVRRYAASAYPEARGEQAAAPYPEVRREFIEQPAVREYSVRPEPQVVQRAYSVRPVERPYYTISSRNDEEVAFVERRRGGDQHEIQYVDALPREVYR